MTLFQQAEYDEYDPINNPKPLNPRPRAKGYLTHNKAARLSNTIPEVFLIDRYTGRPTKERECPIGESETVASLGRNVIGNACYEGPWGVGNTLTDPLTECQGGKFRDNFCINHKTAEGQ